MNSKKHKVAKGLSILFHPVFIPSLLIFVFLSGNYINGFNLDRASAQYDNNLLIFTFILLFASIVPLLIIFTLYKLKLISSIQAEKQEERPLPFFLTAVSALAGFYFLNSYCEVHPVLAVFYFGYLLSLFLALAINSFIKISIHMIGIGGAIGTFILLSILLGKAFTTEISITVFFAGLVAYSRLALKAHNPKQLIYGLIVGIFCETFLLLWI